jgi:hypothetical protein
MGILQYDPWEALTLYPFRTMKDVRYTLAIWREEHKCDDPQSALDYRTPIEFNSSSKGAGPWPTTTSNTMMRPIESVHDDGRWLPQMKQRALFEK